MNQMVAKDMTKWKIFDTATRKSNMDIERNFKSGDKV